MRFIGLDVSSSHVPLCTRHLCCTLTPPPARRVSSIMCSHQVSRQSLNLQSEKRPTHRFARPLGKDD